MEEVGAEAGDGEEVKVEEEVKVGATEVVEEEGGC
jgi:hypothetical protein